MYQKERRRFLKTSAALSFSALGTGGLFITSCKSKKAPMNEVTATEISEKPMFFKISLAQWSLNKQLFGGKLDNLDFAAKAKSLDIHAIEYVNQFFKDKAEDSAYLAEMNKRAADNGVKQLLIMIDGEGGLAELDKTKCTEAVTNHYKWVHAAKTLGCHSIRVNAFGVGDRDEVAKAAVDGLSELSLYAAKENINVIVENHGGFSSDGQWLSGVMKEVNLPNCGTLPDFGNFCVKRDSGSPWGGNCIEEYDRYQGVQELMPYAKAVSAKAMNFNADGDEVDIDFMKLMRIVKDHGYNGYVGIEYEGDGMEDIEGIIATRDLLRKVGQALS